MLPMITIKHVAKYKVGLIIFVVVIIGLFFFIHSSAKSSAEITQSLPPATYQPTHVIKANPSDNQNQSNSNQNDINQLWNLNNVDIRTLINEVSKATGKNFILSPMVKGKVSFISNQPLNSDELYQAFLAILEAQQFVAVPSGKFIKILPAASAKELDAPVQNRNRIWILNNVMATTVIHVNNGSVQNLVQALSPLLKQTDVIIPYAPTNDLIISSQVKNLQRLINIISQIDRPYSEMELVKLHFGQAKVLANNLMTILPQSAGPAAQALKLTGDDRTNSIIISGGSLSERLQLRSLIIKLDIPSRKVNQVMRVIHLKQQRAETLAPILNSMIVSSYAQIEITPKSAQVSATTTAQAPAGVSPFNLVKPLSNLSQTGSATTSTPSSSEDSFFGGSKMGSSTNLQAEQTKAGVVSQYVAWDDSTNSLILTATPEIMAKIIPIIGELDVPRPQVLIQAIVAEVNLDKAHELGVEWKLGGNPFIATRFASTLPLSNIGPANTPINSLTSTGLGQGLSVGILSGSKLEFLLKALANDVSTNILATPDILTLDNQPAEIRVGRKISFAIGQIENNPTGGNPFTSFEREDVGLNLQIRPQITQNGMIKLVIRQEISTIIPGSTHAGGNPDTTDRYIRSTVTAYDGQILVLGGLIQDQMTDITQKVPILGDLPVLGLLFKNHNRELQKVNLMIFLRPVILHNAAERARATRHKYNIISAEQLLLAKPRHYVHDLGLVEPTLPPPAEN